MTDAGVVTLGGDLDAVAAPGAAAKVLAAASGGGRVIVDLVAVEFIDCCAMGTLVRVQAAARCAGGDVLLARPSERARRLLVLTGLADVFSIEPTAVARPAGQGMVRRGIPQHPASAVPRERVASLRIDAG